MAELWQLEEAIYSEGFQLLCGVDEAGRGPLAGPVCAAACILPRGLQIENLNDSKKLTPGKRDELFDIITEKAITFAVAFATVEEIETLNILNATYLAMNRAMEELDPVPDLALIDGNCAKGIRMKCRTVVKGDSSCADIAAASILAKVTRDRYMTELAAVYPGYGFEKHKGYGTAAHYEAIRELGPCPVHRMSFLKKMH